MYISLLWHTVWHDLNRCPRHAGWSHCYTDDGRRHRMNFSLLFYFLAKILCKSIIVAAMGTVCKSNIRWWLLWNQSLQITAVWIPKCDIACLWPIKLLTASVITMTVESLSPLCREAVSGSFTESTVPLQVFQKRRDRFIWKLLFPSSDMTV